MSNVTECDPSEDNINYKAIACQRIPDLFLDKIVAKKHFSKFGKIKRFILRPKRLSCTVEYESKQDAENACANASNFNGIEFAVGYAEHEVAHVQNTEEWVDPDVQAELEAMSPGHRLATNLTPQTVAAQMLQKSNVLSRVSKFTNSFADPPKFTKATGISRPDSPQPEITKIDSAVRNDLEVILKTPAYTDEEKYRVLDARDKLIRMTTVRQTDIKKAVATKGTCPDMCPEKERLMRVFQKQVSTFEMSEDDAIESTISHKKAVKEYSRSSADQEVPLAHELRPESVLQMTMLYLVHRIMGLCDDPKTSLGDWFHFVWDRTRSIRKDITQQELCSLGAVQLVEQCARFHIHCAARLVAEDPSVFDKKINAENLTKCLQTLKYMYHDLRIKGIHCPCEAEFRSYVILLNLGDSNFLWEVKQLPEFIQKSVEVKRAISFYNALQNNNYVRFFSMIKSTGTSYLSACILLGYFTKLRVRAMDAIIKSHNWRKNDVYLPLLYLTRVLGFDDEPSAVNFFSHYGLHCEVQNNRVLLDRLSKPDAEYAMDRALLLVESKRHVSVGECVFGDTLPSPTLFEHHQPHSSFDVNDMLKLESWTADDQLNGNTAIVQNKEKQASKPDRTLTSNNDLHLFKTPLALVPVSSKPQKQHQNLKKFVKKNSSDIDISSLAGSSKNGSNVLGESLFIPFTTESIFKTNTEKATTTMGNIFGVQSKNTNIFGAAAKETANIFKKQNFIPKEAYKKDSVFHHIHTNTEKLLLSHISNELGTETCSVPRNVTDEEKNASEIELENNFKNFQEEKNILRDIELKSLKDIMKQKQDDHEREESEKQRLNNLKMIIQERAEEESIQFIINLVNEEVSEIARAEILIFQMIKQATKMQTELLISEMLEVCVEEIAYEEYALMCYDQLLLNRYFSRWLLHLRKKKEQRKLIENTPLWVTTDTRAQYTQSIEHPHQQNNLQMIKRYRFGQPYDFSEILKLERDLLFEKNSNPLNLFALVGQHLIGKRSFTTSGLLQQRKYFKFLMTLPENKEELNGFESFLNKWLMRFVEKSQIETGPFVHGIQHNVALCVRKFIGIVPKNEQGDGMTTEGDHNDGVVCFITGIDIVRSSRKRLYNLLKLTKNLKRVPLAIIAYNCRCNKEELASLLGLDTLQDEGLIYSYLILGCQTSRKDFSFRKELINAVDFITNESYLLNSNEIHALAMQNVLPFLESTLGEEMWQMWCESSRRNPIFNKICSLPQHVVGLFHKALDHLMHITQEDLQEMPEFPIELKEFVPEYTQSDMPLGLEFFPVNWKDEAKITIVKNFLRSLYLPDIEENCPADFEGLKLWLLKYSSKCIKNDDLAATKASFEAITNLVNQSKPLYLYNKELTSIGGGMINYLNIIKPIIFAHINKNLKYFQMKLVNLNIIYLKDDLKNYKSQPWWLNYEPLNLITVDYNKNPSCSIQQNENKENCVAADDTDKIIAQAEVTSRKSEERLLACKRKKFGTRKLNSINLSPTLQLKRTLDDSIYQFELSKKIGQYDTSFVTNLTDDIDKSVNELLSQSSLSTQKRKRSSFKSDNQRPDFDNVIVKATNLIHKIESLEDNKFRAKKKC